MITKAKSLQEPRIWQRMLSGRRLNLASPSALDIEIEDIARGLSRINRWSGQTLGTCGLSVAQHSVLVLRQQQFLDPTSTHSLRLATLLHDAAEYVIGDLISPFKHRVGGEYMAIEYTIQAAIHQRFGLVHPLAPHDQAAIKRADRDIAWLEATTLAGFSPAEASKFIARKPRKLCQHSLTAIPAAEAEQIFLQYFSALQH